MDLQARPIVPHHHYSFRQQTHALGIGVQAKTKYELSQRALTGCYLCFCEAPWSLGNEICFPDSSCH